MKSVEDLAVWFRRKIKAIVFLSLPLSISVFQKPSEYSWWLLVWFSIMLFSYESRIEDLERTIRELHDKG